MSDDRHNELLSELTVGMADIVGAIERSGADTDKIVAAIVQGLKGAMPQVNLPAPVVNNQINVPKAAGTLVVDISYGPDKLPSRLTIKRIN